MLWKVIPGFPSYEISEYGDVRRCWPTASGGVDRRPRKHGMNASGYRTIGLSLDGKLSTRLLNRVMAETFIGPPPSPNAQACHNDGDRLNNHYLNLRWDTPKANCADRSAHGATARGSRAGRAKITEADVVEIRMRQARGERRAELEAQYGLSKSTVKAIIDRKSWAHVA
jgi:hypothetical protein